MFAYWGLKAIQWFICRLPVGFARSLGRFFGGVYYRLDGRHRKVALENLRRAFGADWSEADCRRVARNSFRELGFNLVEFLRVPVFLRSGWEKHFRVEGGEKVKAALAKGKGIIFLLAHFGNWEYLGFSPRLLTFPGAAVGQEIKNPAVDGLVKDIREQIGLELLPKFEVASSILSYLKRNGAVAILGDQRARKMNVEVDFFGGPAPTSAAPAVLALKSGAAMLPAFIFFEAGGRYRIVFEDEVPGPTGLPLKEAVRELTQAIAKIFERKIRERPELWLWGHRRWRK